MIKVSQQGLDIHHRATRFRLCESRQELKNQIDTVWRLRMIPESLVRYLTVIAHMAKQLFHVLSHYHHSYTAVTADHTDLELVQVLFLQCSMAMHWPGRLAQITRIRHQIRGSTGNFNLP